MNRHVDEEVVDALQTLAEQAASRNMALADYLHILADNSRAEAQTVLPLESFEASLDELSGALNLTPLPTDFSRADFYERE